MEKCAIPTMVATVESSLTFLIFVNLAFHDVLFVEMIMCIKLDWKSFDILIENLLQKLLRLNGLAYFCYSVLNHD